MTLKTLMLHSLRHHWRAHAGVVIGAAVASAALAGALVVGDSVRGSLRENSLRRLAGAWYALDAGEGTIGRQVLSAGWERSSSAGSNAASSRRLNTFSPGLVDSKPGVGGPGTVSLLALAGSAARPGGEARANHVQVFGVEADFLVFAGAQPSGGLKSDDLRKDAVVLNPALAAQLGARRGDEIILRIQRPGLVSLDAAVAGGQERELALRLKVAGVLPAETGGNLSLKSGGALPMNAFVDFDTLAGRVGMPGRANLVLTGPVGEVDRLPLTTIARCLREVRWYLNRYVWGRGLDWGLQPSAPDLVSGAESLDFLNERLRHGWTLADAGVKLEDAAAPWGLEVRSPRVFLDPAVAQAVTRLETTNCTPILTYLANLIACGPNATPYSMVTAAGPPYTPADLGPDEIVLTDWLAADLGAQAGAAIDLSYFRPDSGGGLVQATNRFRVRSIVPLQGIYADRQLMPDFPGLEKAETTQDWDAGFPLVYPIRPQDEAYWKAHRGTPKAFVGLAAGQKMWANRFGSLTSIRLATAPGMPAAEHSRQFGHRLMATLQPADVGLRFAPVREQALRAADQAQDFGQLFLGFSLFLVVAALILMALLFQFGLEQRAVEVGTLLALGFTVRRVRRLFLLEAAALALLGGILGTLGGVAYARAMLWGLTTVWRDAVGPSALQFYATAPTLVTGLFAGTIVGVLTLWFALRRQARRPATELLAGAPATGVDSSAGGGRLSRGRWIGPVTGLGAVALVGWTVVSGDTANAGAFFGAGALLLVSGLALAAVWLNRLSRRAGVNRLSLTECALRNCARRPTRSLATMALLASGSFVILSIGVFHLDAGREATRKTSGTGGFALIGESSLPVRGDLNTAAGRQAYNLSAEDMADAHVVSLRVRDGDDASCLNLNRAQRPRLLGVDPDALTGRFTFTQVAEGFDRRAGWALLKPGLSHPTRDAVERGVIPAIGDANSIQWALGRKVGDIMDYEDGRGRRFKLRLVGAVANSILQGSLVIDEAAFVEQFPEAGGYRLLLIDASASAAARAGTALSRALQDAGLEVTPAVRRLQAFNAVQNTYLGTFQVLGGLGLLLGSAGLGIVVLRHVLERRSELGLLAAIGFQQATIARMLRLEHFALLGAGLLIGLVAAIVAVLPALLSPATELPLGFLAMTLGGVLLNGLLWVVLAARYALRGNLVSVLREE